MTGVPAPAIITCPEWGANRPIGKIVVAGVPRLLVEHHTAGHGAGHAAPGRSDVDVAIAYAKALRFQHVMVNGWIDSGHNFLVMRSGIIVQGRWGTVTAIEHGRMVVSAHCPGQNDQPGIEHEHNVGETMTAAQLAATVALQAWVASCTGIRPTELYPHRRYYATECPDVVTDYIPQMRAGVARLLTAYGYRRPPRLTFGLQRAVNRTA